MRISAASLARIKIDRKFLVALNKNRLDKGEKIYTPFGGALEFYDSAKPFLNSLNAEYEKGNDLRLELPDDKMQDFEKWYNKKENRENSPLRELREELVDEENVFEQIPKDAVTIKYLWTVKECSESQRTGQEGKITQRFLDVYDINFNEKEYKKVIKDTIKKPNSRLALVSEKEIKAGKTSDGIEIGNNCLPLVSKKYKHI